VDPEIRRYVLAPDSHGTSLEGIRHTYRSVLENNGTPTFRTAVSGILLRLTRRETLSLVNCERKVQTTIRSFRRHDVHRGNSLTSDTEAGHTSVV